MDVRTHAEAKAAAPSQTAAQMADQAEHADYFTDQRNAGTRVTPYRTGSKAAARRASRQQQRAQRYAGV